MGASRPWPDAMEAMTGQRELDASAFLEYFRPLEDWLVKTNKERGVQIGWEASDSEKALWFNLRRLHWDTFSFQKSIAQFEVQNGNLKDETFPNPMWQNGGVLWT